MAFLTVFKPLAGYLKLLVAIGAVLLFVYLDYQNTQLESRLVQAQQKNVELTKEYDILFLVQQDSENQINQLNQQIDQQNQLALKHQEKLNKLKQASSQFQQQLELLENNQEHNNAPSKEWLTVDHGVAINRLLNNRPSNKNSHQN